MENISKPQVSISEQIYFTNPFLGSNMEYIVIFPV